MVTTEGTKLAEEISKYLDSLGTDEERREFLSYLVADYCIHCGIKDNGCQCWNDE